MNRPRSSATVVCTLGMHRSGTSLVSRLLNLLGVHLGPPDVVATAGEDNPKGYWEHPSFVDINDELLARFGGAWDDPPAFPVSWPRDPRIADLRERARALLTTQFGAEPLWGWKDPRSCLTVPFWQDLIGPMRYVICIRNPSAVAASLTRRNGMSPEKAERLWQTHVQASLAHTGGEPRMFLFYEDLIDDAWPSQLRRMSVFIGCPERADDPRVRDAAGGFLEKALCHHGSSMEDLVANQQISFPTKGLYVAVRDCASRAQTQGPLGAPAIEASDWMAGMAAGRDALLRENLAQAATIAALCAQRDRFAAEAGALVEHVSALAREREAALLALQEIQTSCAWKLVAFSRGVIVALLPLGTRRRRLFNAILRHAARYVSSPHTQRTVVDPRSA